MNITENILAKSSNTEQVEPGEIIESEVNLAMSHDGTSPPAINTFRKIASQVWDPTKIAMVFDHNIPANNIGSAEFHRIAREFAKQQNLEHVYVQGEGICHQVLPEKGLVKPGSVIVGADSHTCTYGAFGAFATGVGATDMAMIYATGKTWFLVPESLEIEVEGVFKDEYVTSKDLILDIIGEIGSYGAAYKALEFKGETIDNMSVPGRMTMCNMAVECGAKNGIMEPNTATLDYLRERGVTYPHVLGSDVDADYELSYYFNVDELEPVVACPNNVDNVHGVSSVEGTGIDQAFIGSCTNGRLEDLKLAASILKDKQVSRDVRLLVIPASREIYREALHLGLIDIFIDSNCIVCNPGCGPCLGAHMGVLGRGEVCIATTNRNFLGRMGDPKSLVYLANPAVVAASAITGEVTDPRQL